MKKQARKTKSKKKNIGVVENITTMQWIKHYLWLGFIWTISPLLIVYYLIIWCPMEKSRLLGWLRIGFVFGVMGNYLHQVNNFLIENIGKETASVFMMIYAILALYILLISVLLICGWYNEVSLFSDRSNLVDADIDSDTKGLDQALSFRDSIVRTKISQDGKLEELKKTGFWTRSQLLSSYSGDKNVNSALSLVNSRMKTMSNKESYEYLKNLLGKS